MDIYIFKERRTIINILDFFSDKNFEDIIDKKKNGCKENRRKDKEKRKVNSKIKIVVKGKQ